MTSVDAMVHIRPDDRAHAYVATEPDPHVVLTWGDTHVHAFLRGLDAIDATIAQLQLARDGLALLLDQPVPYEPTLTAVPGGGLLEVDTWSADADEVRG